MAKLTRKITARGMHCRGCEQVIESALENVSGVIQSRADYASETVGVTFDPERVDLQTIFAAIAAKGYACSSPPRGGVERTVLLSRRLLGLAFGLAGIALILWIDSRLMASGAMSLGAGMGYGLLFLVGLLTGFHCVGMCGGFVVGYCAREAEATRLSYRSHLYYGAGKLLSYSLFGALFGLLGSIVAFTPSLRGAVGIGAGLFLLLFGLNMLNALPPLRRFSLPMPVALSRFVGRTSRRYRSPFVIGLLNGLMIACGPLQAMYVMAAGTGSALQGAKMLFVFGAGTLPVMLGFGALTGLLSSRLTHRLLKASGMIVIVLGAVMINRGMLLRGTGYDLNSVMAAWRPPVSALDRSGDEASGYQVIEMHVNREGYSPDQFTLIQGVPVKWVIYGDELTHCNRGITVPQWAMEFEIQPGRQTIEFRPEEVGVVAWSCWMGMIPGRFVVVAAAARVPSRRPTPRRGYRR